MLPNDIQYSRHWMNQISGKESTAFVIEFGSELKTIDITMNEIALLVPFLLTAYGALKLFFFKGLDRFHKNLFFYFKDYNNFAEHEYIRSLHDIYSQALVHEMRLNKRTQSYLDKLSKVINPNVQLN
jgi:hypothetical protein